MALRKCRKVRQSWMIVRFRQLRVGLIMEHLKISTSKNRNVTTINHAQSIKYETLEINSVCTCTDKHRNGYLRMVRIQPHTPRHGRDKTKFFQRRDRASKGI